MSTPLPKVIWGTLAAAAVATALAGCGPASNANPAAAGASATPTGATAVATPGSGTEPADPGPGTPSSAPSAVDAPTTAPPGDGRGPGPGGKTPVGEAPPAGTGTGGAGTGGPHCTGDMLSASLVDRYSVETNRYVTLVLTNTSGTTCSVRGWSDLQLVNAAGLVSTDVLRHGTPQTVALPSGGRAYERLYWTSELAADESVPCQPAANTLRIVPPNQDRQLEAPWRHGPVCRHGKISLTPLSANPTGG